jgi:hypothetical protein
LTSKSADYFKRLLESQNKESKAFASKVKVSGKAQEAELTAQRRKSHVGGETLIMTASTIIVSKRLGQDTVRETANVLHSNNMINRCTDDMSHDEDVLCGKLKNNCFSNQVDNSNRFHE